MQISRALVSLSAASALAGSALALDVPVQDDAQVLQANPTFNYGLNPNIAVYSNAGAARWSYLKFDPASYLPAGYNAADITQAVLYLYVNTITTAGSFSVSSVTSSWTEGKANGAASAGTVTWNLRPTDSGTALATVNVPAGTADDFIALDVTDVVKSWVSSPAQNFGLVLKPSGTVTIQLDSKENVDSSHGAKLSLTLKTKRVAPAGDVTMGSFTAGPLP